MPKAYLVACYRKIKSQDKWAAYTKVGGPAMQKAGGRFIARGMPTKVYEAGVQERLVIVEFDSVERAIAAHDSPDYQEALRVLGDGAERDIRLVPGVE